MNIIKEDIETIVHGVGNPLLDFEGKEILISGACGFLGSWFIAVFDHLNRYVFAKPVTVYAVDSFIAADQNNSLIKSVDEHIHFIKADISTWKHDKKDSIDYIIHAAGIASPIYYRKFPVETIDGMVLGLSNLLKFASEKPVKSFLNFSSSEMYGNPHPDAVPTPESYYGNVSATGPRSCYDESKRMGEAMCAAYHRIYNIPVKWVRPFNVYGPGMRVKDDRVIPKFMFQMLQGEPVTVHVPGIQTRTFCYITDAMVGFFKTLLSDKNGEVYNIGKDTQEISMVMLAQTMKTLFAPEAVVEEIEMPTEYPRDQAQRRQPLLTKAREDLLYDPKVTLEEGLHRMWEWGEFVIGRTK